MAVLRWLRKSLVVAATSSARACTCAGSSQNSFTDASLVARITLVEIDHVRDFLSVGISVFEERIGKKKRNGSRVSVQLSEIMAL
jgi:hypothetical protein